MMKDSEKARLESFEKMRLINMLAMYKLHGLIE